MRFSDVHTSLNRRKAVMGVPAFVFALESFFVVLMMGAGMFIFIPCVLPIHFAARWMHARDDGSFASMINYQTEKDVYDPWARPATTSKRPAGYGKNLQC